MNVVLDGVTFLLTRDGGRLTTPDGLYHRDTRYLSKLAVDFDGSSLQPLHHQDRARNHHTWRYVTDSSSVNRLAESGDQRPSDLVLARDEVVQEGAGLSERFVVTNHSATRRSTRLKVDFDVDFAHVFEVRELIPARDRDVRARVEEQTVDYRYTYRDRRDDEVTLSSVVGVSGPLASLEPGRATFEFDLQPQASTTAYLHVRPNSSGPVTDGPATYDQARSPAAFASDPVPFDGVSTPFGRRLVRTAVRSINDLEALTTETEVGPVPVAGVPWFATVFGRDALLAAYQLVPFEPTYARTTLRYLAARQGETVDADREEEPGKILHEIRHGEPAETGRIPHTPYYGSVDATPLWVILLHETHRWVGDDQLVSDLWGPFERAMDWIESAVSAYGDGPFLYYGGRSGLPHKAWRDTPESVQYGDGQLAQPPLASVEVQGYVYDSLRRAAALVRLVEGDDERADAYRALAEDLAGSFHDRFWMPGESFYAAALTEAGEQVDSVTSNVGHALWSGVVEDAVTTEVADRLLAEDMFSGWGIRTMSEQNAGYSPVSYHTGSVWPHDNALIALGLAESGFAGAAEAVTRGLFAAFDALDDDSVPELFGGFDDSISPAPYPAACAPQAWAASAPFGLIRAVYDLQPESGGGVQVGVVPEGADIDVVERLRSIEPAGSPRAD